MASWESIKGQPVSIKVNKTYDEAINDASAESIIITTDRRVVMNGGSLSSFEESKFNAINGIPETTYTLIKNNEDAIKHISALTYVDNTLSQNQSKIVIDGNVNTSSNTVKGSYIGTYNATSDTFYRLILDNDGNVVINKSPKSITSKDQTATKLVSESSLIQSATVTQELNTLDVSLLDGNNKAIVIKLPCASSGKAGVVDGNMAVKLTTIPETYTFLDTITSSGKYQIEISSSAGKRYIEIPCASSTKSGIMSSTSFANFENSKLKAVDVSTGSDTNGEYATFNYVYNNNSSIHNTLRGATTTKIGLMDSSWAVELNELSLGLSISGDSKNASIYLAGGTSQTPQKVKGYAVTLPKASITTAGIVDSSSYSTFLKFTEGLTAIRDSNNYNIYIGSTTYGYTAAKLEPATSANAGLMSTTLYNELKSQSTDIANLKKHDTSTDASISSISTDLSSCEENVKKLTTRADTTDSSFTKVNSSVKAISDDLLTYEENVKKLTTRADKTDSSFVTTDSSFTKVNSSIEAINSAISALQEQLKFG